MRKRGGERKGENRRKERDGRLQTSFVKHKDKLDIIYDGKDICREKVWAEENKFYIMA